MNSSLSLLLIVFSELFLCGKIPNEILVLTNAINPEINMYSQRIQKNTLIKIEDGLNPLALTNILELKLLDYLGITPNIDSCCYCGSNKQIITLSSDAGGYICKNCYNNEPLVSEKTIKMIRMYYYVDISSISKLDVSSEVSKEINIFLDDYYDRFAGLYLKSKKFINEVSKLDKAS